MASVRVGELVQSFRAKALEARESLAFAEQALLLRYPSVSEAPIAPDTLVSGLAPPR